MDAFGAPATAACESVAGGRPENQDRCYVVALDPSRSLWGFRAVMVVADGMGGHARGDMAAQLAVDTATEVLGAMPEDHERFDTPFLGAPSEEVVRQTFDLANERIYEHAAEESLQGNMGTTMTALVVTEEEIVVGHVGDSKAFIVSEADIEQLTEDHSWVAQQVREGRMTPDEAADSPLRGHLTQAIGVETSVAPFTRRLPAKNGAMLIVCSDGLTEVVDADVIRRVAEAEGSPAEACHTLVSMAVEGGTRDNVTVGAVSLGPASEREALTDPAQPAPAQEHSPPLEAQEAPAAPPGDSEAPPPPTTTGNGEGERTVGGQRSERLAILAATCMLSLVIGLFVGKLLLGSRGEPVAETGEGAFVPAPIGTPDANEQPPPASEQETETEVAVTESAEGQADFALGIMCEGDRLIVSSNESVTYDVYPRGEQASPSSRLEPREGATPGEVSYRLPEAPPDDWHEQTISLAVERLGNGRLKITPTPDELQIFVDHQLRSGAELESVEVAGERARIGLYFPPSARAGAYAVAIADLEVEPYEASQAD